VGHGGIASMLLVLVLELLRRLVTRYRRGLFGTRLMARMAGSFVLMTVVPVALVFFVAVQFVGRSIESWFDVPLERALDSGLVLARASLDSHAHRPHPEGALDGRRARRHAAGGSGRPCPGCATRPACRRRWC
jgi:nitrogen fixation/metabolism regulation signal transduction histidine kinase